ncbi:hypothetical protein OSCT_0886 [Oscillochloris trichoides DG-6]|uniref:ABC transporter permease n=1 Tax=Oscillochloris trichoides DG-6 TaxID=765420 RepID=E1IC35_9CHLR|nr:ABC transporter permease [Oscillochloris trichoides]EFO81225.1 hypothetical protein OSCT_0886 [Oscillochloris trichoides DG-6]
MTLRDMFVTALENLGRRKVRTILTSTGVIVGILTIVTMVSLGVGVQSEVRAQFAALGLENLYVSPKEDGESDFFTRYSTPERSNPITPTVISEWERLPGVVGVVPAISLAGVNSAIEWPDGKIRSVTVRGPQVFMTNPFQRPASVVLGRIVVEQPGEVVVAQGAIPEGMRAEDLVGSSITIMLRSPRGESERFALRVVGVSNDQRTSVETSAVDMAAMKAWWFNTPNYLESQGYDTVMIRTNDVRVASQLLPTFRDAGFEVQSLELILDTANRVFALINVMLSSIGGLALFVASLGIINTMIMAIYERTREIGTLKAIGASRSDIRNLFMIEAGMIGALGGVVGIIGGWLLGILLNHAINWYIAYEDLPIEATFFVTPWWLALAALVFAALIGVVAGLYPAARAARLDPLVALRYE